MPNTLDAVFTRLSAVLTGAYPAAPGATDRQITPGTFTAGSYRLPSENPRFPPVTFERRFELQWDEQEYDGESPDAENQTQGPHVVAVGFTLRVSYALTLPPALTPAGEDLDMGAIEAASRKAQNDWRVIEWAWCWRGNWSGVSPDIVSIARRGKATTARADTLRLVLTAPMRAMLSIPGVTNPGLGT